MTPARPLGDATAPSLLADGRRLLGEVDAHRAPGDAAAAADAARRVELVPPGRQLVGEPLPVARRGGGAHRPAVQVRVVEVEARRPGALAADARRPGRWCRTRRCRSRSGRPGCSCRRPGSGRPPRPSEGARGCGRAARPARRSRVGVRSLALGRARGPGRRAARSPGRGVRAGEPSQHVGPALGARPGPRSGDRRSSSSSVSARSKPASAPGPRAHRRAEAGGGRGAALGDHDEGSGTPGGVAGIGDGALEQDPVEHVEGGQLAGSGADRWPAAAIRAAGVGRGDAVAVDRGPPQLLGGREELGLPRSRADRPAEHGMVLALLQAVLARGLHVVGTDRQVGDAGRPVPGMMAPSRTTGPFVSYPSSARAVISPSRPSGARTASSPMRIGAG